jgi:U3 small nucleolar RNA-associated protein 6
VAFQRLYLISSLRLLASQQGASPSLYSSHIRLLISPLNPTAPSPAKVLKLARRYTSEIPRSADVWLVRLAAEKHFATREEVEQAWSDARNSAEGTTDEVERVWVWGLTHYTGDEMEERLRVHEVRPSCILQFNLDDRDWLIFIYPLRK